MLIFINLTENDKRAYLNSIKKIVDFWLNKNYLVYFFCMSNSNKQKENDSTGEATVGEIVL